MKTYSSMLRPIPVGCIRPEGWLGEQVRLQIDGFFGHMTDISFYLQRENGWLNFNRTLEEQREIYGNPEAPYQTFAWEEQAYWLRGAYKLALVSRDEKLMATAMEYINAMLASACEDGWFGPLTLKDIEPLSEIPMPDIWPHMVMLEVLRDYYLETKDEKAISLMSGFVRFCMNIPDEVFMPTVEMLTPGWWFGQIQTSRVCEPVSVLNWLGELTDDEMPFRLSARLFREFEEKTAYYAQHIMNFDQHVVNFAQRIKYHATNYAVTGDWNEIEKAERHYLAHMEKWGQMPAGLYAADENVREGKTDPRQGTETCAMSEIVNSFLRMAEVSGRTVYADRTEDIMLNSYPASHTPDYSGLHYITADNQVVLDANDRDYCNKGCMTRYDGSSYRCCQHNTGWAWPNYLSSMFLTGENTVNAWVYGPAKAEFLLEGSRVSIREQTDYPFRNEIRFEIQTEKGFTFRLRVPGWAKGAELSLNGEKISAPVQEGCLSVDIAEGASRVEIRFVAEVSFRFFRQNNNCVCVDYGALTFSLKLKEKWTDAGTFTDRSGREWHKWDVRADSPYNYALNLSEPVTVKKIAEEVPLQPFTPETAPVVLEARAHLVEGWGTDETETVQPVPESLNSYEPPEETVTLVPLGAMRVRMSCFPHCGEAVK